MGVVERSKTRSSSSSKRPRSYSHGTSRHACPRPAPVTPRRRGGARAAPGGLARGRGASCGG
jgi:hypothetical protein